MPQKIKKGEFEYFFAWQIKTSYSLLMNVCHHVSTAVFFVYIRPWGLVSIIIQKKRCKCDA